jgi:hypothetical protein
MSLRFSHRPAVKSARLSYAALAMAVMAASPLVAPLSAQAAQWPVTPEQRSTAEQVASLGVPLSELAANAPDSYTVKPGDTLWAISKVFLKSPWRWPELWGMNLAEIRNPHLIYPGQLLVLEKTDGRARLKLGQSVGTGGTDVVKLSPSIRSESSDSGAITAIPMNLIAPFLNDAVVFEQNQLATAPRIVATQEGHVLLGKGDLAYVKGPVGDARDWRVFRDPKPLVDPYTHEVLGYEARYVGSAEHLSNGESRPGATQTQYEVPSTFKVTSNREDAGVGDRLMPDTSRDFEPFVPHPANAGTNGAVVSIYGDAMTAGPSQIISINRGARDGLERGNVLALWHEGALTHDTSVEHGGLMKLPDERVGVVLVFRVFDRASYGLILDSKVPAEVGDRLTTP